MWVDRAECKIFVENIQTAFHTKRPKSTTKDHLRSEQSPSASKLELFIYVYMYMYLTTYSIFQQKFTLSFEVVAVAANSK